MGLLEISTLTICAAGSETFCDDAYLVIWNGSLRQSVGETNCGSVAPPSPRESRKNHCWPWLAPGCVVNALNVSVFGGVGVGDVDCIGEGDANPARTDCCRSIENSVPVPLSFKLYENRCGVVPGAIQRWRRFFEQ
jgi:hypothetical protein